MRLSCGLLLAALLSAQPQPEAASISGKVIDSLTGAPVRKVSVSLAGLGSAFYAITSSDGTFRIAGLKEGYYQLSAYCPGFLNTQLRPSIKVGNGQSFPNPTIRLKPSASIKGRILDEDGDPLGQTSIRVFKQIFWGGNSEWTFTNRAVRSNDQGEYLIEGLHPGRYLLEANSTRHRPDGTLAYAPTFYPSTANSRLAFPLALTLGLNLTSIDIRVVPPNPPEMVTLSGRLSGVPVGPGIRVLVSVKSGPGVTVEAPDDSFQLKVTPGPQEILAQVVSGNAKAYAYKALTISADTTGIDLPMMPPVQLRGQILPTEPSSTQGFERISVTLGSSFMIGDSPFKSRSGNQGHFLFDKLIPPGRSSFSIDPGFLPPGYLLDKVTLGGQTVNPEGFEVTGSPLLQVFLAKIASTINVRVENGESQPQSNVFVTLHSSSGSIIPRLQTTGDDGKTTFTALPPGNYFLIPWTDLEEDFWRDHNYYKRFPAQSTEVTLAPAQQASTTLLLPTDH